MADFRKIQFIICANDKRELEECRYYINRLSIPDGMRIDITVIEHAVSMAAGYNYGMAQSDANTGFIFIRIPALLIQGCLRP
ncbi:hypothetical protein D3Z47_03260 [Lachnospiraceae bacterium]|nr:hypothetical protein [Lachnospiraceae bacterium]